jgi:hypothetical protein
MMVSGIDTKQDERDARFPIGNGESWQMEYEVQCENSPTQNIVFAVRCEGRKVEMSRVQTEGRAGVFDPSKVAPPPH